MQDKHKDKVNELAILKKKVLSMELHRLKNMA